MNQGVAGSSPVQQRMVDSGSRSSWWCADSMRIFPHQLTPLVDDQDLPESWSQLLLEGPADEEGKPEAKKLQNWEQLQLLNQTVSNHGSVDVKPETSTDGCTPRDIRSRVEFQTATLPTNAWSHHQMVSASSPISCITTTTTTTTMNDNMVDFGPKSSDLKHLHEIPSPEYNGAAKKARLQPSSAQSSFKVRKEKLGDRITALHQLVSPFGKTDTASVLLEAIGYIRFLQTQIQALSLPYLGSGAGSAPLVQQNTESKEEQTKDLRSRGLCLVPISCTVHVGSEINGADYWASAFGANFR